MKRMFLDAYAEPTGYWKREEVIEDVDGFHIHTQYNDKALADQAKIMRDNAPGKEWRHAAIIPQSVMDKAYQEGWFHDKRKWKEWANNPENKAFRTWEGRL